MASAPWSLLPLLPSAPSPRSPQMALTSSAPCPSPAGLAPPWEAESSSTSAPQHQVRGCWSRPPAHVGPRAGAACSHFQPHFLASPRLPQVPAASGEPGPGFLPPAPAERTVVDKRQPPFHPPLCLPASGVGRESNRVYCLKMSDPSFLRVPLGCLLTTQFGDQTYPVQMGFSVCWVRALSHWNRPAISEGGSVFSLSPAACAPEDLSALAYTVPAGWEKRPLSRYPGAPRAHQNPFPHQSSLRTLLFFINLLRS